MRILNQDNNKSVDSILILMTYQEACEMRDDLERMISSGKFSDHSHITDIDFKREITLSIYDGDNIEGYQERIKKLIIEQE